MVEDAFVGAYDLLKGLVYNDLDTAITRRTIYQKTFETNKRTKYMRWVHTIAKKQFNDIEFSRLYKSRKSINTELKTWHQKSHSVDLDEDDTEGDVVNVDTISTLVVDLEQTFANNTEVSEIIEVDQVETEFSFYASIIPQSEHEMEVIVQQINFFYPEAELDTILDLSFTKQKNAFSSSLLTSAVFKVSNFFVQHRFLRVGASTG